jgi:hypothetical protein
MSHASNIVYCSGPDSPHAFDIVPLQPRNGSLDAMCAVCQGHGQWNTEIDLVSFRCKRARAIVATARVGSRREPILSACLTS